MRETFDFSGEFADADFIVCGHGDGRGTEHIRGWRALREHVFFIFETDLCDHQDDWEWSDEMPAQPFWLHLSFEAEGLTIVRLHKSIRVASPQQPAPAQVMEKTALDHLSNVLVMLAELHDDDRCRAFTEALSFYNAACPDAQIEGVEGYSTRLVQTGPLDALLPQAGKSEAGWLPIESAPKDGTPFLAWEGSERGPFKCWRYEVPGGWYWTDHQDSEPSPTYWMPLPAPPITSGGGDAG